VEKDPKSNKLIASFYQPSHDALITGKRAALIVRPETVLKWHRTLAAKRWTKDKPFGRRPVSREIRQLVIRVKNKNRLWGPKRIHGEMLKLGIQISESSIRNILRRAKLDPLGPPQKESWRDFTARHKTVWAMDYFTVHSATFKRLFVLVMMDINTRELICTRVTAHPTREWMANVLRF
jgi:putative transposase